MVWLEHTQVWPSRRPKRSFQLTLNGKNEGWWNLGILHYYNNWTHKLRDVLFHPGSWDRLCSTMSGVPVPASAALRWFRSPSSWSSSWACWPGTPAPAPGAAPTLPSHAGAGVAQGEGKWIDTGKEEGGEWNHNDEKEKERGSKRTRRGLWVSHIKTIWWPQWTNTVVSDHHIGLTH